MVVVRIMGIKRVTVRKRGKLYVYYRHRKTGKVLRAQPGSAEFAAEAARLDARAQARAALPGSLGDLIAAYREAPEHTTLALRTRKDYERVFVYLEPCEDMPLIALDTRFIYAARDAALASLFGVSRQAIYDWQAGKSISQDNAAKLDELAEAARMLQLAGVTPSQVQRRKIGGKTLLETIRDGGDAAQEASKLLAVLQKEAKQRADVESFLRGRRTRSDRSDLGIPHLDD